MIDPEESQITPASHREGITNCNVIIALKQPGRGGVQKEGRDASLHAVRCRLIEEESWSKTLSGEAEKSREPICFLRTK
ncbi:hypothetical protein SLA2020_449010 [Shorea laevis]